MVYRTQADALGRRNASLLDVSAGAKMAAKPLPATLTEMSITADPAAYLRDKRFVVQLFWNNQAYWYNYISTEGLFMYMHTSNPSDAQRLQRLGELEVAMQEVADLANRNAKALASLKSNLHPALAARFNAAVNQHNSTVNEFKRTTPAEMKVVLQQSSIAQLQGVPYIGIAPVVLVVVAVVGLAGMGLQAYTITRIVQLINDTVRHKNNLNSQYRNIQAMMQADRDYKAGLLTEQGRNAVFNEAQRHNEALTRENQQTAAAGQKSIFDEAKGLLIWGTLAVLSVKILPTLFTKSTQKNG
ncbi:MAG TPA: hypothetical protein PKE07_04915 [Lacibacter sp.]|nr:hypothetical protein [Lacibacter sp.]HMO89565.1 hypothetical protein [Lacibacter sp.]